MWFNLLMPELYPLGLCIVVEQDTPSDVIQMNLTRIKTRTEHYTHVIHSYTSFHMSMNVWMLTILLFSYQLNIQF